MTATINLRHVQAAQKAYSCAWCGERIEDGTEYYSWFSCNETATARMHPECFQAMQRADLEDDELYPAGTFRRGCWHEKETNE